MVGVAQTRASLAMHLMSGVDVLKHVREQMVDTLTTIEQRQYRFSCITGNVSFLSSVVCF